MFKTELQECYLNSQIKDLDNFLEKCIHCTKECVLNSLEFDMNEKQIIIEALLKDVQNNNNK